MILDKRAIHGIKKVLSFQRAQSIGHSEKQVIPESRTTIHMGINFVISPVPTIDMPRHLIFQQSLVSQGIDFEKTDFKEQEILVIREAPTPLHVRIAVLGPPTGQLVILAPHPRRDLGLFAREAEAVVRAFDATWPEENRQLIGCDATLRDLFEASGEHAFRELWETRLGQSRDALAVLGRPVLGGGLRFVMPARREDPQQPQVEVKIESFLRDTKKIFVETQFAWPPPRPPGEVFDPRNRLQQVDAYIENEVISFVTGGST